MDFNETFGDYSLDERQLIKRGDNPVKDDHHSLLMLKNTKTLRVIHNTHRVLNYNVVFLGLIKAAVALSFLNTI